MIFEQCVENKYKYIFPSRSTTEELRNKEGYCVCCIVMWDYFFQYIVWKTLKHFFLTAQHSITHKTYGERLWSCFDIEKSYLVLTLILFSFSFYLSHLYPFLWILDKKKFIWETWTLAGIYRNYNVLFGFSSHFIFKH